MRALAALTERVMRGTLRDADVLFAVLAPVACFVAYNLTLRNVIDTGSMSYADYVLPVVVVQAMLFGAMTTADRAARDQLSGFGIRLRTQPIAAAVPLTARMLYCLLRAAVALGAAVAAAYAFGFRMTGGFAYAVAFALVALMLSLGLSLGAEEGSRVSSVESLQSVACGSATSAGHAVHRNGAGRLISRLARAVCAQSAGFAGYGDAPRACRRARRDGQSGDQPGVVRRIAGGVRRNSSADAGADEMTVDTRRRSSLAVDSVLQAGRLLTRWRREPTVPVQSLLFPSFLLLTYELLLGKSVLNLTGSDSLYGLVPMCAVVGTIFGALGAGVAIPAERESGLLSRLWVLPVHRGSALTGRLIAEAARALAGAMLITALGVVLGLRFASGWSALIPFVGVPVLVVIGFSTVVMAIAVRGDGRNMVTWLGALCIVLLFFNSGIAPIEMFPSWLQPAIRLQPMSPAIEAMRAIAGGGGTLWPLLQTFAWTLGLTAVFGPMAVRGYRVAAESGC